MFLGSKQVKKVFLGTKEVKRVYVGMYPAWMSTVPVMPAGITKNGTYDMPNTSRGTVPGWTVRSGYAGTIINNNRIQVVGSGTVTVYAEVFFAADGLNTDHTRWIVHNGVDKASAMDDTTPVSATFYVEDGDFIWIDALVTSTLFNYERVTASSYVTVTPV